MAEPPRIGAVILAAGEAGRFGAPKQLARVAGRPLLEHVIDAALSVPALDPIVVVLGAHADEVRAGVAPLRGGGPPGPLRSVVCTDWAAGQSASLRAGIEEVGPADAVLVLLGDQPFISPQVIAAVLDHFDPARCDAVRAVFDGAPGHPVLLGPRVLARAQELTGDAGARDLLTRFRVRTFEAGHLCDPTDIDTPDQLEALSR